MPVSWTVKDNRLLYDARKDLRRSGVTTKAQITESIKKGDLDTDQATFNVLCRWCGIPVPKQNTPKAVPDTSSAVPTHDGKTRPRKAKAARVKSARASVAGVKNTGMTPRKLKKPTVLNIEAAMDAAPSYYVKDVNIQLKKKGFAPVNSRLHGGLKSTKAKSDKTDKPPALNRKRKSNYVKKGGNGGTRPGAGRKKGVSTAPAKKRTAGIADDLAGSAKITPLEYMIEVLNETPDQLIKAFKDNKIEAVEFAIKYKALVARRDEAAKNAAPYLHPRLSSITASITTPEHEQYIKDCEAELALLLAAVKK